MGHAIITLNCMHACMIFQEKMDVGGHQITVGHTPSSDPLSPDQILLDRDNRIVLMRTCVAKTQKGPEL